MQSFQFSQICGLIFNFKRKSTFKNFHKGNKHEILSKLQPFVQKKFFWTKVNLRDTVKKRQFLWIIRDLLTDNFTIFNILIIKIKCKAQGSNYAFLRDCKHVPDVFFFSVILYVMTFFVAITFRNIKFSNFFGKSVRKLVGLSLNIQLI